MIRIRKCIHKNFITCNKYTLLVINNLLAFVRQQIRLAASPSVTLFAAIFMTCDFVRYAGGLDEALQCVITECQQQSIPFVFALNRSALGRACVRKVPVSIVGIFNYEGAEVSCFDAA